MRRGKWNHVLDYPGQVLRSEGRQEEQVTLNFFSATLQHQQKRSCVYLGSGKVSIFERERVDW